MPQLVEATTGAVYPQIIYGFLQIICKYPKIIDKLSISIMSLILGYPQIICRNPQIICGYPAQLSPSNV